jgi:hypothetical protein
VGPEGQVSRSCFALSVTQTGPDDAETPDDDDAEESELESERRRLRDAGAGEHHSEDNDP